MAKKPKLGVYRPPSTEQITMALEAAKKLLTKDEEWYPAYSPKLEEDWDELGIEDYEERTAAIVRALQELSADAFDPPPPPGTALEPVCRGATIFQFVWPSVAFDCAMFFRFAIGHDGYLFIFSIHRAKFPKK